MEAGQPAPLRPLILALIFLVFVASGCSGKDWQTKIYIVKAENAFSKAYSLRTKKEISYEERLSYYRTACDYFFKAYQSNKRVFTLNRIELAAESCLRIKDFDKENEFQKFAEEYVQTHPDEAKYGDAGAFMSIE